MNAQRVQLREVASHFPYRKKGMVGFFKNWIYPVRGLRSTYELESSLKVELAALPMALVVGKVAKLSLRSRLKILGLVSSVVLVELLNTSTEELARDKHPRRSPHLRRAMDAAAAAVMVAIAIAAIGTCYIVWDDVSARYAALSYDELVARRAELEQSILRIRRQGCFARLVLSMRRAVYRVRTVMLDQALSAREGA